MNGNHKAIWQNLNERLRQNGAGYARRHIVLRRAWERVANIVNALDAMTYEHGDDLDAMKSVADSFDTNMYPKLYEDWNRLREGVLGSYGDVNLESELPELQAAWDVVKTSIINFKSRTPDFDRPEDPDEDKTHNGVIQREWTAEQLGVLFFGADEGEKFMIINSVHLPGNDTHPKVHVWRSRENFDRVADLMDYNSQTFKFGLW